MALQQNSNAHNTNHSSSNTSNNNTNNNLNKNLSLPLTIIPLTEDALIRQQQQLAGPVEKPPDLTFHCMCCEEYFVNPFHMYEHLNTKHADLPEPQESEEELDDSKDYSWVFEPVCELVADEGLGKQNQDNDAEADDDGDISSSSSSDSDSDDDSSTTTSSSSSSSSSDSSSNANSNSQDEATRDAMEVKDMATEDNTTMEVMEEAAYEEVEAESMQANLPVNGIKLEAIDPKEQTPSVLVLNPAANTTITPVMSHVKRGRGRRSAAQQAAIEMSSLISGEPKCFQCSHCEASFPSAGDLSKHVRCHITNKPFQCSICEKTFTHIGSLNTHIRIHSGEKPYKCELCSKAFTQSSSLMVHLRSHSIKKPHQCNLCDKGFVNSTSLAIHLKTHTDGGASFSCTECDKSFKQEFQLQEHLRMHTLSLVYQCSICRIAFASSSELVQHMKCHMGEKPFTCSICDRAFTQSGSLNIHMRIHTGEKPFNCKFCNKAFTQASSLSVHMKIHSGEKPFPCHICGKSYSQAAYLNKHIHSHLEAQNQGLEPKLEQRETLLCIVCGELHRDANSLAIHVTQKHAALLNNMHGQTHNFPKMEISEEERLRQEQMYMQQIQMLMQMQQQMIKRPITGLQPSMPLNVMNPVPINNVPQPMGDVGDEGDDREIEYGEKENGEEDCEQQIEDRNESEDGKQKEVEMENHKDIANQQSGNESYHEHQNDELDEGSSNNDSVTDENQEYQPSGEYSNESHSMFYANNQKEQSPPFHPNEQDYNEMDHRYIATEEMSEKQDCSNDIEPMCCNNENELEPHVKESPQNHRAMENTNEGDEDRKEYCNTKENVYKNYENERPLNYDSNSQQYSDDESQDRMEEHEITPNHTTHNSPSSPEYQEGNVEENINYEPAQRSVIQNYQHSNSADNNNEYHNDSEYEEGGNGEQSANMDIENESGFEVGDSNVISDVNDDIEMSEYPFIDDTKFNFYDDYAAEEEVETAE